MVYEMTRQQLDEIESWTAERYELLAELALLKLGEAIANAERVRPQYGNAAPDEVLLARLYREAARILRDHGVSSEEELPDPDRETFARWVADGEGCITSSDYQMAIQGSVPLVEGTTNKMLTLLYPAFAPSDLREAAGDDRVWLDELRERRAIQAMSDGLRAQFCHDDDAHDRIRASLKGHLTADLAGEALTPGRGSSDRRLLAVSREVLGPTDHAELMAEIEAEFAGWCRHCGTMPDHGSCDECGPIRRSTQADVGVASTAEPDGSKERGSDP